MKSVLGNLWDFHKSDGWIVIPTNGFTRKDGTAVMGRGVALQATQRFPLLASSLGSRLRKGGNHIYSFLYPYMLFSFPVKHNWWEKADLELIKRSVDELIFQVDEIGTEKVALPRVGCGNGGLSWADVKPLLNKLDDRFTVVSLEP